MQWPRQKLRERHKSAYLIDEFCMCCTPRTCVFHFGITCCTLRTCFWHFGITCCTPARAYFILVSRAARPARAFARASFIFWHYEDFLVHSTSWNHLFCSCVDDASIRWQMCNFVFSCPKRSFQFNSRMVRTHFSSIMTSNNWKMIAETRSYIFRWRSRFRRRWICSLLSSNDDDGS